MSGRKIIITCLVLLAMILPQAALAATTVHVRPGLNGLYKMEGPVQLNINIINDGPAIENAVLEVRVKPDLDVMHGPGRNPIYRQEFKLSADSTIAASFLIPGYMARNTPYVYLYAGGKEIACDVVQGMAVGGEIVIASAGERPLAGGLPVWAENNGDFILKYLSPAEVPEDILALSTADILIIDQHQLAELTPVQAENIKRWTALGGCLILSKGAGAGEGQPFADISPVKVGGESNISGNLGGLRAGEGALAAAAGSLVAGKERAASGGVPVLAERDFGRGCVIYSAIGLEDLKPEDVKFWGLLFNETGFFDNDKLSMAGNSLVQNSANIAQLKLPSVKFMAGVWVVYMIIIAPGLYLVLKRYRRSDWAWACIPVIALITAVAVYFSAPFHRLSGPLGQTLAVVDIINENVVEIKAGGSFVLPRGGDLSLEVPGHSLINPEVRHYGNMQEKLPVIEYRDTGQELYYKGVEFWSMRQASVYKILDDFGQIQGDLRLKGSTLSGALVNKTPVDLTGCLLTVGGKALKIGKLPAGKTVDIDVDLKRAEYFNWEHDLEGHFPGFKDRSALQHTGHVRYADNFAGEIVTETGMAGIGMKETAGAPILTGMQLIGYTDDLSSVMRLKGAGAHNHSSALVIQQVALTATEDDTFYLPAGLISPEVIESHGPIEHTPDGQVFHGDQVKLEYRLLIPGQCKFTAVDLPVVAQDKNYRLGIYNWQQGAWEELQTPQNRLLEDQLQPYISNDYRLRISIQNLDSAKNIMPLPGLAVEGVVIR